MNTSSDTQQTGFTLVEIIVVILVVGILAVTVMPRFFARTGYDERRALDDLMAATRYAQQLAMSRGGNVRVVFAGNSYSVEYTDGTPIRHPDGSGNFTKSLPAGLSSTVTSISFNALGAPTPNGALISVGTVNFTLESDTGYVYR